MVIPLGVPLVVYNISQLVHFARASSHVVTPAPEEHMRYDLWSCQKVTSALIYLLDNIYIRFGSNLHRQNVGIPMGTNCAPLVADLFLFCYERDFMKSLTKEKRYDLIDAFNSTSRYLDDLHNIDNIH